MNFLQAIEAKRDGHALESQEIGELVAEYTAGRIPDYQMAAFLMAVFFRGLDAKEVTALTQSMLDSGDRVVLPPDSRPVVDKHSTGGVGDKVSLPLAPLLACLGFRVPMISGRGLGITGGTLDKLESVPGFSTALSGECIVEIVQKVGCVICGQTERMVPADKKLYALRDVTGTVPSIPLIVASILSKKLAENLDALVLDVKFGEAAFMRTIEQARELAQAMVNMAGDCGVRVRALLTRMDAPLGTAAGNWLEVKEAVQCLENAGPPDLQQLVLACATHALLLTGRSTGLKEARDAALASLLSGAPRQKFDEMLAAQGADLAKFSAMLASDTMAREVFEVRATSVGWVTRCDARAIGELVRDLGGGRLTRESTIDPTVGVDRLVQSGKRVSKGDLLGRLHLPSSHLREQAVQKLSLAIEIGEAPSNPIALVAEVVG